MGRTLIDTGIESLDRTDAQGGKSALESGDETPEADGLAAWSQRITDTMPIELVTGWATIEGIVKIEGASVSTPAYWATFGVLLVLVPFLLWATMDADERPTTDVNWANWLTQVLLAVSAFVVWVYYLGGPFQRAEMHNQALGAILLVVWGLASFGLATPLSAIQIRAFRLWRRFRTSS